jgi:cytosine deaminase
MTNRRIALPADVPRWRVLDARAPACLLSGGTVVADAQGLTQIDLTIEDGRIGSIVPAGTPALDNDDCPVLDLAGGMIIPTLVDAHTHLDKGHIAFRTPEADGTHPAAARSVMKDRTANWNAADVRARMEFALRCAYAHGTSTIRTHIDSLGAQARISWPVFAEVRDAWRGRMNLQASPLLSIEFAEDATQMRTILEMVDLAGCKILGAVTNVTPRLHEQLDIYFRIASERGYDLDFHVDETNDPQSRSLAAIAATALKFNFKGRVLAGHCCSLAVQPDDEAKRTIDQVAKAGIAVVSLPMCNMYLQDRSPPANHRTPRWRGVTAVHELKAAGVDVMIASDNTRDPFYAYGDLDMLEVWREGTRILHLDHPVGDWPRMIGPVPAATIRVPGAGLLEAGGVADFILLKARSWTELFSRPQSDRTIIRSGRAVPACPPSYGELDELNGAG